MVPVTRTQLVDVDVEAVKKVIWDIEADPQEQQLQVILNEAEATSDGLYRCQIDVCTRIDASVHASARLWTCVCHAVIHPTQIPLLSPWFSW
jgi:hypothetical protein